MNDSYKLPGISLEIS